jgi:Domain of unknown function (DUF6471)
MTGREEDVTAEEAKRIIRTEMVKRGYSYDRLSAELAVLYPHLPIETRQQLTNKVNRGRFSFAFVLRVMRAMGVEVLNLMPTGPGERGSQR